MQPTTAHRSVGIAVGLLLLAGCATPVGVVRVGPRDAHRTLTSSVLTSGDLSAATQIVLQEEGLARTFDEEPEAALARLHAGLVSGRRGIKVLFPLAELAFRRAQDTGSREWYLATALYAWAFLFPDDPRDEAGRFDRRVRMATDLYNIALAKAFGPDEGSAFVPRSRVFTLPFGDVEVRFDESTLHWRGRELVDLVPLTEFEVRGLRARYRHDGIGAPLAASLRTAEPDRLRYDLVRPGAKSPVTALLTFPRPLRQIRDGRVHGVLKLHVARLESESADVVVDDRSVPLELDQTAVTAYGLSDTRVWDRELGGFFRSLVPNPGARTQLGATGPYRPGLTPVVFVHGTASSPARWAEMYNRLVNSSRLHGRVQFWYFMYDTGAPIPYSAGLLRNALTEAVAELDPEGRDSALKRMVLIGHSQGGLLVKMNTISSGSRLWDGISRKPLDELKLSSDTRERVREMMFVEPLSFVERVIFLCTPHRGSFQARNIIADLFRRIVTLPAGVVRMSREIATGNPDAFRVSGSLGTSTSLDHMNPLRPFIRSLADIPVAPGVRAHSIIAVEGDGPRETGSDGVVTYRSAHIDGVESELVVRSGHSAQGQPEVIAEVMRILQLHAGVGVDTAAPVDAGPPLDVPRATR